MPQRRACPGWPQFTADSVFSTAAVGDLYGTGTDDLVVGGASSPARPTAPTTAAVGISASSMTTVA